MSQPSQTPSTQTSSGQTSQPTQPAQEDVGKLLERVFCLLHSSSKQSFREDAEKKLNEKDLFVSFNFEAEALLTQCGLTLKALNMITHDMIFYSTVDEKKGHSFAGPSTELIGRCVICAKQTVVLPKKADHPVYTIRTQACILHEGKVLHQFKHLRFCCGQKCYSEMEAKQKELQQTQARKLAEAKTPPPPPPIEAKRPPAESKQPLPRVEVVATEPNAVD